MKTILDSVKISLSSDAKMNKGVYSCVECSFKAPFSNVVPYMTGIAPNTNWGTMVVWECPKCFWEQFFHYREGTYYDYQAGHIAYKLTKNSILANEAALHFIGKEYTEDDIQNYVENIKHSF